MEFATGVSLIYGSKLVLGGTISVGDFVAFNGYIGLFVNPVSWVPNLITKFKRAQISYQRLDKIYSLETENISKKNILSSEELQGDISIQDLSFNYPGNENNVLENINIDIKKGETIRNYWKSWKWKNYAYEPNN